MLITVTARLVRSHGVDERALPGSGRIEYRPASHGTWEGALRGRDAVVSKIADGEASPVELTPGPWQVTVVPDHGPAWSPWLIELEPGMPEPVDLVSLAPVVVVDGEKWAKGDTPVIEWDGTRIVIDGEPGPDLQGIPGPEADTTAAIAAYTEAVGG